MASPGPPPGFAEPYREAHLESVSARSAPSTVRASALERLGAHLAADENFGRKLSKDAARALNGVDYLTDREKHLLAGMDKRAWAELVEASDKFKVAVGKKAAAGVPTGPSQVGDYLDGFEFGGHGGAPSDWGGGRTTPGGPGITLGNGIKVGGHLGGGGSSGSALGGSDDGGRGRGGFGSLGDFGGDTAHGNAGDPKSPTGGRFGGSRGRPSVGASGLIPMPGEGVSEVDVAAARKEVQDYLRNLQRSGKGFGPKKPVPPTTADGGPSYDPEAWEQYKEDQKKHDDFQAALAALRQAKRDKEELEQWKAELKTLPPANPPELPPAPPPKDPTANPNPEDPRGPGPVGPQTRGGARGVFLRSGREAMPNPEDQRGPGPVGPQTRGGARGAYLSSGREAMPNPEDPRGPVGPSLRGVARSTYGSYRGDVMPDPNADPGRGGPVGPAT